MRCIRYVSCDYCGKVTPKHWIAEEFGILSWVCKKCSKEYNGKPVMYTGQKNTRD